jgi:hypothetical protein
VFDTPVIYFDGCHGGIELRSGGWLPECTAAVSEAMSLSAERSSIEFFDKFHFILQMKLKLVPSKDGSVF